MPCSRTLRIALSLSLSLSAGAAAVRAQDANAPRATVAGQEVIFAAPVGMWSPASNRVSVLYSAKALSADAEAADRKAGKWTIPAGVAGIIADFDFKPGTTGAMATQLAACHVSGTGLRAPLDLKGGASDCHILSIGGILRSGGAMIGIMQGQGANYSLRLPFSVALMEAVGPAGAPAAAPASTPAPTMTAAPAAPAIPANTVTGTGTFNGQRVTVNQGLAWAKSENNEVDVALFDHNPPAGMLADLRKGSWGAGGPTIEVTLHLANGPIAVGAVTYCYVNVTFPNGGPIGFNGNSARSCGLSEIGGTGKAGGTIAARIKGQSTGPGDKPYTWDLTFNLPIAR